MIIKQKVPKIQEKLVKKSLRMQPCPRLSFKVICQLTLEMAKLEFLIWCGSTWKTCLGRYLMLMATAT